MSVSAVGGNNWLYTNYLSTLNRSSGGSAVSKGPISGNQSNSGGNDTLLQSIMQAFGQVGISTPSQFGGQQASSGLTSGASVASTDPTTSANQTGSAHHSRNAFGKFMHDLFSAVESESGSDKSSSSSASSTSSSPYSSFSSKLEQLISQLGTASGSSSTSSSSSATPSASSSLGALQSDFNNLVSSLSGNSSSSASATSASGSAGATTATGPDLTTFLQDVLANLGTAASTSSTGNLMNLYS